MMQMARRVMLLCATVVAVMGLGASTASAQETSVEFVDEAGGQCSPCLLKLAGESHITSMFTGQQVFKCHDTVEAELWHDGSGHVHDWKPIAHEIVGPGCLAENCDAAHEREWDITAPGETGPDASHMVIRFCMKSAGNVVHCNGEFNASEPVLHVYQYSTTALCAFSTRRYEATWTQVVDAAHPAMEIIHL
jgi:hypothetical protein